MSDLTPDPVARALNLLYNAAVVSPYLREPAETVTAEVERLRLDLSTSEDKLAHATQAVVALRARVPNPDDLRTICNVAQYAANTTPTDDPESLAPLLAAVARVRATLEGTE